MSGSVEGAVSEILLCGSGSASCQWKDSRCEKPPALNSFVWDKSSQWLISSFSCGVSTLCYVNGDRGGCSQPQRYEAGKRTSPNGRAMWYQSYFGSFPYNVGTDDMPLFLNGRVSSVRFSDNGRDRKTDIDYRRLNEMPSLRGIKWNESRFVSANDDLTAAIFVKKDGMTFLVRIHDILSPESSVSHANIEDTSCSCISLSPDGYKVCVGSSSGKVLLYGAAQSHLNKLNEICLGTEIVDVAFSECSTKIMVLGKSGSVHMLSLAEQRMHTSGSWELRDAICASWCSNEKVVFLRNASGEVHRYNLHEGNFYEVGAIGMEVDGDKGTSNGDIKVSPCANYVAGYSQQSRVIRVARNA